MNLDDLEDLLDALADTRQETCEFLESLDAEKLTRRPREGVWSPAENIVHLIKSVKAVVDGMNRPRLVLFLLFGHSDGESRSYEEIVAIYHLQLAEGGKAGGDFLPGIPAVETPEQTEELRARILSGWKRENDRLAATTRSSDEESLDRYRLPHPLIGKLTLREMLYFTYYHNQHHLKSARRAVGS